MRNDVQLLCAGEESVYQVSPWRGSPFKLVGSRMRRGLLFVSATGKDMQMYILAGTRLYNM